VSGLPRPCLGCGESIPSGSRCKDCRLPGKQRPRGHVRDTARWRRLSTRLRQLSPFCEIPGCSSTDLTVDHVISLDEDLTLAYEPLNCRVLCNHHNGLRQHHCTDAERQAVHSAIAGRKAHQTRYYASQSNG
jgi:5-methylcytosine-specific restriction endonuclease McrA